MLNTVCKLHNICQRLHVLMKKLGLPSSASVNCNGQNPCQNAFDAVSSVVQVLNVDNAAEITNFIQESFDNTLPINQTPVALKQILHREPFYCGEIGVEIRQPCSVTSCAYWSDNPWTRNCILFYSLDQHRPSLDVKELTFLLGRPSAELRRKTNSITAKLRHWALKHKTEQQEDRLDIYSDSADGLCPTCGSEVVAEKLVCRQGFCYCSRKCADKKPPLDLRIESDFSLAIDRVLQICVDSFGAKRPICHALKVTAKELESLCQRYQIDTSHLQ